MSGARARQNAFEKSSRRAQGAPAPPGTVRLLRRAGDPPHPLDAEGRGPQGLLGGEAREAHHHARAPPHLREPPRHARGFTEGGAGAPGHESIEMTLRYSHLTPDVKREAVQLLDRTEKSGDIR